MLASALGLGLLLFGAHEAASLRMRLSPANLLIGARQAVRAPDGSLFVASDLARVHVYDADGHPLRGFLVPTARFRVHVSGPDRLLVLPEDAAPLAFDFAGTPAEAPTDAELASAAEPEPAADAALRIEGGDVVRVAPGRRHVLVHGYASHGAMLFHVLWTGLCLFVGGLLLIGGMLATGRRAAT